MSAGTEEALRQIDHAARVGVSSLDLQQLMLDVLPGSIGDLASLTTLNLNDNRLTVLPESLGNLVDLRTLDLDGNRLSVLPDWLGNLTGLTELNLNGNRLSVLPDWLGNLTGLTALNLGGNRLTELPQSYEVRGFWRAFRRWAARSGRNCGWRPQLASRPARTRRPSRNGCG
jgi:Leucine-rich repeat (LRR) protein